MKRRSFLQLVGIAFLPLPDVEMGKKGQAHIQLYDGNTPVSEPLPVPFRLDAEMKATLQPDRAIRVTKAVLRSSKLGERVQQILPLHVLPCHTIAVCWVCRLV